MWRPCSKPFLRLAPPSAAHLPSIVSGAVLPRRNIFDRSVAVDVGYGSILVLPRQATRCVLAHGAVEAWPTWRGLPAFGLPHVSAAGRDFVRHCEDQRRTEDES